MSSCFYGKDITQRKQEEENLRRQVEELRIELEKN